MEGKLLPIKAFSLDIYEGETPKSAAFPHGYAPLLEQDVKVSSVITWR